MIIIKNKQAVSKMTRAGQELAQIFELLKAEVRVGRSTADLDQFIASELRRRGLVSKTLGFRGYRHVSCISLNDEVVHGVPSASRVIKAGDLVKIDICAAWSGYCADMARCFLVDTTQVSPTVQQLVTVAYAALDLGIAQAVPGKRLSDISAAIQAAVEQHGFGVVRDFAGHGVGKFMHEDPEVPNFGRAGMGPVLQVGMTLALEPMITAGAYAVTVLADGWTVQTRDRSWAAHVEDTVLITAAGPQVLTR
ncbi:MAG TPA: type I methionyl aminopeptidase [Candidatus Babeliales bacterium]|nr:type I methionyl aminopeptidase [Candidatus Babeliales bacterium]